MILGNPAYVALALSEDDKMGQDSVIECVPQQGTVRAHTSWTLSNPYGVTREDVVSIQNHGIGALMMNGHR